MGRGEGCSQRLFEHRAHHVIHWCMMNTKTFPIDETYFGIQSVVDKIKEQGGVALREGLSERQILEIERIVGAALPRDLRALLSVKVPVDGARHVGFPDWHNDPQGVFDHYKALIEDRLLFDVEKSDFWHPLFGEKPDSILLAKEHALTVFRSAAIPRLIPIYGHRFMIAGHDDSPVISYMGPADTVVYGVTLKVYLEYEFLDQVDPGAGWAAPDTIPFWSDVLRQGAP